MRRCRSVSWLRAGVKTYLLLTSDAGPVSVEPLWWRPIELHVERSFGGTISHRAPHGKHAFVLDCRTSVRQARAISERAFAFVSHLPRNVATNLEESPAEVIRQEERA